MSSALVPIFSHSFSGIVWNTLAVEAENLLFIETRDDVNFQVKFSLLDYHKNTFVWKDVSFPESWWLSMLVARKDVLLLTRYVNKVNPDQKSLVAVDVSTHTMRWQADQFSFFDWNEHEVFGYSTQEDFVQSTIDITDGRVKAETWKINESVRNPDRQRAVFYAEGTPHFETVKKFVAQADFRIALGVEYLEYESWILISVYAGQPGDLANYLLVFSSSGELVLNVKLGEKLAGLGTDTFFILSGCLFLVKNKTELVAYRL